MTKDLEQLYRKIQSRIDNCQNAVQYAEKVNDLKWKSQQLHVIYVLERVLSDIKETAQ